MPGGIRDFLNQFYITRRHCSTCYRVPRVQREVLEKMLSFSASQFTRARTNYLPALGDELERRKSDILKEIDERDLKYFATEVEKLDA